MKTEEEPRPPLGRPATEDSCSLETDQNFTPCFGSPGEDKLATILIANITGLTALAENFEAEENRDLFHRFAPQVREAVERNRGTVCRLTGGGVVAIFGTPVVSEGHAIDACEAALDMQRVACTCAGELKSGQGNELQIRAGLHSGEVVVPDVGEGEHIDYYASDPAAAIAAVLGQAAGPGTVLISEKVNSLAAKRIESEPFTPVTIKGIDEAVPVFLLKRVKPAGESDNDKARTRFIGNQRITVSSASFRNAQMLHAVGILVIPLLGTVAALWFSLQNGIGILEIGLLVFFYTLSILGITVGFHRHFAHKSFSTSPAIRFALGILGSMAAQGPVTYWVSNHRRHHRYSDCDGDPHSPHVDGGVAKSGLRGFLHAHIGWTMDSQVTNAPAFSLDLLRDPLVCAINRSYYAWVSLGLLAPAIIGGLLTLSWQGALGGFLWGGMVRLFLAYHATNSINSLTHLFGSRPFETRERSHNNFLLVLPTLGEGLHNNHHAFPGSALFGYRWWHFDLGGWFVQGLEGLGLVWDVRRPPLARVAGITTERGEPNE